MIKKFIERFDAKREWLLEQFKAKHPEDYAAIVKAVITAVQGENDYSSGPNPDPERVHQIDDGSYQGTLVFVIGEKGYQPENYWTVKVNYGSCSGCDTLEAICGYSSAPPTEAQAKDYFTLALHIVQGLRLIEDNE